MNLLTTIRLGPLVLYAPRYLTMNGAFGVWPHSASSSSSLTKVRNQFSLGLGLHTKKLVLNQNRASSGDPIIPLSMPYKVVPS
jgi:hypothetical protein